MWLLHNIAQIGIRDGFTRVNSRDEMAAVDGYATGDGAVLRSPGLAEDQKIGMDMTPEPALSPSDRAMVVNIARPVPDYGVHQLKTGLVADRLAKIEMKRKEVRPPR